MSIETNTTTLEEYYSRLSIDLVEGSWVSPEEARLVHSWHDVMCRVLDAGDRPTSANVTRALTGRFYTLEDEISYKQYSVGDTTVVPDHVPDDIDKLPRVDGVATDYSLSQMLKREVELCPISAEPAPVHVEINSKG